MHQTKHVYALFDSHEKAAAAHADLQAEGCSTEHCSAIMHERHVDISSLSNRERASREGTRKGAAVGGAAGMVIGGLTVLGGNLLGVGPLAAMALTGGAMAAFGGVLGGIAGSDEPDKHIRALAESVENGKVLIAVETDDPKLRKMCETVFERHGGQPITV